MDLLVRVWVQRIGIMVLLLMSWSSCIGTMVLLLMSWRSRLCLPIVIYKITIITK